MSDRLAYVRSCQEHPVGTFRSGKALDLQSLTMRLYHESFYKKLVSSI